jgi:hypothetical protein
MKMTSHYCIGNPCKLCFPDPNSLDTASTSKSPYIPYIKYDEDLAKKQDQETKEGLARLAEALAYAWEANRKLSEEISTLKDRIKLLEEYAPSDLEWDF